MLLKYYKSIIYIITTALLCTVAVFFYSYNIKKPAPKHLIEKKQDAVLNATSQPIRNIGAHQIYDLSGSQASGGSDWLKLFDEPGDPKNGIPGTTPVTDPLPPKGIDIFYPEHKGLQVVIDLQTIHHITDLYIYERGFESDSLWIYTGNMNEWKLAFKFLTTGKSVNWGWKNTSVNIDSRYLMLRFSSNKSTITELTIYGFDKDRLNKHLPQIKGSIKQFSGVQLSSFMGVNSYDWVAVKPYMSSMHSTRLYQYLDWYDSDISNNISGIRYKLNNFNLPEHKQLRWYADSLKQMYGHTIWPSIRGIPKQLKDKGYHHLMPPVDFQGADVDNPASYKRHANLFWNLAAAFGSTKVNPALLQFNDVDKFSGVGLIQTFENGNEEDGAWTKYYWTPTTYFALSSADYDGHERKLGNKTGIKNADKNSRLMMSGMVQLDTHRVRTLKFLCDQLRKDKKFIWDAGVQYHLYSNDQYWNHNPTKGLTPEIHQLRKQLAKVYAFQQNLLPGVPVILGENGYDRNKYSWQSTPLINGLNEAESQGVMTIRSVMAVFMSGFNSYHYFMLRNAGNEENPTGTFGSSGMLSAAGGNNTVYPVWHYWNHIHQKLGMYLPDAIIKEEGVVWVYKLRNKLNKKKVVYYLVNSSLDKHTIKGFTLSSKTSLKNSATILEWQSTNTNLPNKNLNIIGNVITVDVGQIPIFIECEEN